MKEGKTLKRDALVTVRLPSRYKAKLEQWAERDDCSISDIINNLICNKIRREKNHEKKLKNQKDGE